MKIAVIDGGSMHMSELAVLAALNCVPSYYLRYFYTHDQVVAEQKGAETSGQRAAVIEAALRELYRDPSLLSTPEWTR